MAFRGRDSGRIMPIYNTKLHMVPRGMCTKLHQDILITYSNLHGRTDGRSNGPTDSRPDFNSSLIIYIYIYKQSLGEQSNYTP